MPGLFDNFSRSGMPLPSESQAAAVQAQRDQFAQQALASGPRGSMLAVGLGQFFSQRREQRRQENVGRIINEEYLRIIDDAGPGADLDISTTQRQALHAAAARMAELGNHAAAQEMITQAGMMQDAEAMSTAELSKLVADTESARANATESLAQAADVGATETIRLQSRRTDLMSVLGSLNPDGPAAGNVARMIDELSAEITKRGTITGTTEHDPGAKPTSGTTQDLQDHIVQAQATVDALNVMVQTFDPSFYTLGGRIGGGWLRFQDIMGMELEATDKSELAQRTTNLVAMRDQLNAYIHMMTGAQVGQAGETTRLMGAVPNEGNGPEVMRQKMEYWRLTLPAIQARNAAALASSDIAVLQTPLSQWGAPEDWTKVGVPTAMSDPLERYLREAEALGQ